MTLFAEDNCKRNNCMNRHYAPFMHVIPSLFGPITICVWSAISGPKLPENEVNSPEVKRSIKTRKLRLLLCSVS